MSYDSLLTWFISKMQNERGANSSYRNIFCVARDITNIYVTDTKNTRTHNKNFLITLNDVMQLRKTTIVLISMATKHT